MKWILISGSWRKVNKHVERDVREAVTEILARGDGIITGGAWNVDYFAIDQAFMHNAALDRLKVFLPAPLALYAAHYRERADDGLLLANEAELLITQLTTIKQKRPQSLIENSANAIITIEEYRTRERTMMEVADQLYAFHVNNSPGTQIAIANAKEKGIPIILRSYTIP